MNLFGRTRNNPPAAPRPAAPSALYGLAAEFDGPNELLSAARKVKKAGYQRIDAFSPFPIHELDEAVGFKGTKLPLVVLLGGVTGAVLGFLFQWYTQVIEYPLVVFGRPPFPWPAFIPITFECGILGAAFAAVIGMVLMNGLPLPYHPMFGAQNFDRASQDAFFLCIEANDPKFDRNKTQQLLQSLNPRAISEVQQ